MPKSFGDASIPYHDHDEVLKDNILYYKNYPVYAAPAEHRAIIAESKHYLLPGAKVLDLGAGTGAFSLRLLKQGFDVTAAGLEPDKFRLKEVPFLTFNLNQAFSENLSVKYDAVFATEVIEHLENIYDFFRKINLLLKPDGIVFIATPNVCAMRSRLAFAHSGNMFLFSPYHVRNMGHIQAIPYWLLEFASEQANFNLNKIVGIGNFLRSQFPAWQNLLALIAEGVKRCFYREKFPGEFGRPCVLTIYRKVG